MANYYWYYNLFYIFILNSAVFANQQSGALREYRREIGQWIYFMDKFSTATWPEAFEKCRQIGASLVHPTTSEEMSSIHRILTDAELRDLDDFWSAGVSEKKSKQSDERHVDGDKDSSSPPFVNIDLHHELNLMSFLHGDSRCVAYGTSDPGSGDLWAVERDAVSQTGTNHLMNLHFRHCSTKKAFMCQEPRRIPAYNTSHPITRYFTRIINGWKYTMDLGDYATWLDAFERCKAQGANLISAAKYDPEGAVQLTRDPLLISVPRFWSAGLMNRKRKVNTWMGKSVSWDKDPQLLETILNGKLDCIYHRVNGTRFRPQPEVDRPEVQLNFAMCGVPMLYMCEQPVSSKKNKVR